MNIQHSSRTDKWGTPLLVLDLARLVLGDIDLDPASSALFNRRVRAQAFIDEAADGLRCPWPLGCSVFVNPPGGKTKNRSNTALFWGRLMQYRLSGHLKHAIFLAFSVEALQTTQGSTYPMGAFPFCVPRRRIAFETEEGVVGGAPAHSNAIAYIPGSVDERSLFARTFSALGFVTI